MSLRFLNLLATAALLSGAGSAEAATFCVTDGATLKAALAVADSNGQADVIRLAAGIYGLPAGDRFEFRPGAAENFSIELSGGWTTAGISACGQRLNATNGFQTLLLNDGTNRVMNIEPPANSSMNVTVSRISFLGGNSGTGPGGGLRIWPFVGATGTILVEQCGFVSNDGGEGAGLAILTQATARVRNSVFVSNETSSRSVAYLEAFNSGGIYVTNTTMLNNTTTNTVGSIGSGLEVRLSNSAQALVANNNLWGNQGLDMRFTGAGGPTYFRHNNVENATGIPSGQPGNIAVQPVYESGSLNYTPVAGSPLIDAGIRPPQIVPIPVPFDLAWAAGVLDINGNDRIQANRIDIGAYETTPVLIFSNSFE